MRVWEAAKETHREGEQQATPLLEWNKMGHGGRRTSAPGDWKPDDQNANFELSSQIVILFILKVRSLEALKNSWLWHNNLSE